MTDVLRAEDLRLRRQELANAIATETEQAAIKTREAEQHQRNAERNRIRIEELDHLLAGLEQSPPSENVIPMRKPAAGIPHTKRALRYRNPGATTDLVMLAYGTPGIEVERLITAVYEKYKSQGTSRETVSKLVNRMIREGYARREGTKFYLTDVCKQTWEASPLYLAS